MFNLKCTIETAKQQLIQKQQSKIRIECLQKPKLRTFVKFKDFFETPAYITKPLSFIQRKFLAKTRLGCLEIRLETGRWARPRIPEEARICQVCENFNKNVEDEFHFIFECFRYSSQRALWFEKLEIPKNFQILSKDQKLGIILNHPNNVKVTAQYLIDIFDIRSKIVNKIKGVPKIYHISPSDRCIACNLVP